MTGIMILFGRDKIMAMEWTFLFNAGICGVLISRLEGKVAALRIFFFFLQEKKGVQALGIRESSRPPPPFNNSSSLNIVSFFLPCSPACLRKVSVVPRKRCKSERTGQEKVHNRVHTDCSCVTKR